MLFAAGTRSPGHCSHDGETGHYDRRNRPRCASGIYPQTFIKAGMFSPLLHKVTFTRVVKVAVQEKGKA